MISRAKLALTVLIPVVLCGLATFLIHSLYQEVRQNTIKDHNERQLLLTEQAAFSIENFFTNHERELEFMATMDSVVEMDQEGRQILDNYFRIHNEQVNAVTRVDSKGRIVYTAPYNEEAIGVDISAQEHVVKMLESQQAVTSDVFLAVQGYQAIATHVPVFKDGRFDGSIALLIPFQIIIRDFIKGAELDKGIYPFVVSGDGKELMCPINFTYHTAHAPLTFSIIDIHADEFPSMVNYGHSMLRESFGTGEYMISQPDGNGKLERMHSAHHCVDLGSTFWSISMARPEEDVLASLSGFRQRLLLVLSLTLILISTFAVLAARNWSRIREQKILSSSEEELRLSESKYRNIIQAIQDVYFRLDLDGRLQMISPSGASMLGLASVDELIGKPFASVVLRDADAYAQMTAELHKHGAMRNLELPLNNAGKQEVIASLNSQYVLDSSGQAVAIEGIIRDITERRQAQLELERSRSEAIQARDQYEQVVTMIPEIIWRIELDSAGNARRPYISPAGEKLIGLEPGTIQNDFMKLYSYIHEEDALDVRITMGDVLKSLKKNVTVEYRLIRPDGKQLWLRSSGSAYSLDDGGRVMVGTSTDITQIKENEREREVLEEQLRQTMKLEAIGNLAGGIAHDFNNILHSIIGNTELAREDLPQDSPVQENLAEVSMAAQRASELVNQILTFARKSEKQRQIVDVAGIVNETYKLLRPTIPASIDIRTRIEEGNHFVLADPIEIHQVLMNLCSNASQAMTSLGGRLEIAVSAVREEASGNGHPAEYVCIAISDSGPGIDPQNLSRIFEPFFTTKQAGKGTGMGLAVVHGIVNVLGGSISVDSKPGSGSRFTVLLPATTGEYIDSDDDLRDLKGGNELILVAEDEAPIVRILEKYLRPLGYRMEAYPDGSKALEAYQADPSRFDLVLTDQNMPEMTGDKLIRSIMEINPDQKVILCTGFSEDFPRAEAHELSVRAYLNKPITQRKLAESVREVLDRA